MPAAGPVVGVVRDLPAHAGLDRAVALAGGLPGRGRVVVLVALGSAVHVSPDLLHALLERVRRARRACTVLASVPTADRDAGWTVPDLALAAGLGDEVLLDPWQDLADADAPASSLLHGRTLSATWRRAPTRVLVGAAATDAAQGHALTLPVLLGLLRPVPGAAAGDLAADLLRLVPPRLVVLDATWTSHGSSGSTRADPLPTATVVAGRDPVVVDLVGATLLGLDPAASTVTAGCLRAVGTPPRYTVDGDLRPFTGLRRPPEPLLRAAGGLAASAPALARLLAAAATPPGPDADPDDRVLRALRTVLTPLLADEADPVRTGLLTSVHGLAGAAATALTAWRTTVDKDSLARADVPLGLDEDDYDPADHEAVETEVRPWVELARALPTGDDGLGWRRVDGAVVFEVTRTVRAPYEQWVERVDVSEGISLMADYLGGRRVVRSRDEQGRPVHQAERNVYLPQPNYLALSGGVGVDVVKLQVVRRGPDAVALWWRTVASPNGSADLDDGVLEFSRVGPDRTRLSVAGRQRFTVPLLWQVIDLSRYPELHDALTTDAYRQFFTTTFDNLVARYEGRPFAIGRESADEPAGAGLSRLVDLAVSWLGGAGGGPDRSGDDEPAPPAARRAAAETDELGFRHFRGGGRGR